MKKQPVTPRRWCPDEISAYANLTPGGRFLTTPQLSHLQCCYAASAVVVGPERDDLGCRGGNDFVSRKEFPHGVYRV